MAIQRIYGPLYNAVVPVTTTNKYQGKTDGLEGVATAVFVVDSAGVATPSGTAASPYIVVGNVADNAVDSGAPVKAGGRVDTTLDTYADGDRADLSMTTRGLLRILASAVNVAGVDGVNNGNLMTFPNETGGSSTMFPVGVVTHDYNGTTWDRHRKPNAASRIPSAAATTNPTSAKASAGDVHCISGFNAAASVRYLKFYAKATAPTVGTDTPVLTIALPVGAFNINLNGHYIPTGIAYGMTTGAADADTGALTLADIVGLTITYA